VNPVDLTGACPGSGGLDWPYTPKGGATCAAGPCTAQIGSFYEGGVDLTSIGFGDTCFSTFLLETRSSATIDAILKDFALGSFNTCSCSVTPASQSVCDGNTATFTAVNPQGATPPFTYKWDGIDDAAHTQQTLTTGVSGTHTVVITDANGLQTTCSGTLTLIPAPTPTVTVDTSCADSITLTASGGTEYNWDGAGFSTTATLVVSSKAAGSSSHTVEVKNASDCRATKTVHIGLCCEDCDP